MSNDVKSTLLRHWIFGKPNDLMFFDEVKEKGKIFPIRLNFGGVFGMWKTQARLTL